MNKKTQRKYSSEFKLSVTFGATCDADTTKVKGFIWDSLTNFNPLTGAFSK